MMPRSFAGAGGLDSLAFADGSSSKKTKPSVEGGDGALPCAARVSIMAEVSGSKAESTLI